MIDLKAGDRPKEYAKFVTSYAVDSLRRLMIQKPNENVWISPLSISSCLTMQSRGASAEALTGMMKALKFLPSDHTHPVFVPGSAEESALLDFVALSVQEVLEHTKSSQHFNDEKKKTTLSIARSLWIRGGKTQNIDVDPGFVACLEEKYEAALCDINAGPAALDAWCTKATQGKITNMSGQVDWDDPDLRSILIDAIFFKAPWSEKFKTHHTRPLPFTRGTDGHTINLPTMQATLEDAAYAKCEGFQMALLSYGKGQPRPFACGIILPPVGLTINDKIFDLLTPDLLSRLCTQATPDADLRIWLPKVSIKFGPTDLSAMLQQQGMTDAFQANGMIRVAGPVTRLDKVVHMATLDIDEQGTEAAAITMAMCTKECCYFRPPRPIIELKFNRPFLIAILHLPSSMPLFMGGILDPSPSL